MHISNFKHHLLIAMPSLSGDFFSRAVVYIYEHSAEEGAVGFTVNKPLSASLGNVLEHLKLDISDENVFDSPVFSGGPVGPDQGFVLHDRMSVAESEDDKEVTISTSRTMLKEIGDGKGPDHFIVTLGYAGWGPGQLEEEVLRNDWLVVPYSADIVFDTPIAQRWEMAAKSLGVDFNNLSGQIGHA